MCSHKVCIYMHIKETKLNTIFFSIFRINSLHLNGCIMNKHAIRLHTTSCVSIISSKKICAEYRYEMYELYLFDFTLSLAVQIRFFYKNICIFSLQ